MPDIQTPDPGRKLQARYRLIGTTPAPFLSPELVPVVILDDLTDALPGKAFAQAGDFQGGAVGVTTKTRLSNLAGSEFEITDIQLRFSLTVDSRWQLMQGPTLSNPIVEIWQDRRRSGSPQAVVTAGLDVGAVANEFLEGNVLAFTEVIIQLPNVVLAAGDRIDFGTIATDCGLSFGWEWAERLQEE